jgi:hypothetical protein
VNTFLVVEHRLEFLVDFLVGELFLELILELTEKFEIADYERLLVLLDQYEFFLCKFEPTHDATDDFSDFLGAG